MNQTYNPYDNVLQVVQQAADILGYSDSDIEAIKYPESATGVLPSSIRL